MLARLVFAFLIFTLPALAKEPPRSVVQTGKASIYADRFQGQLAANGEPHDQNDLTAASRLLPLGARATVTNLETGKSVQVEITDRGPYAGGRIIDLSRRAAREIGLTLKMGVGRVTVEAIPARQPTLALKEEVAQIAAARAKPARQPLSSLRRERYGRE
ncbi:MAG: septal ring lytic transglycosylase RlpA family protein [Rhodospirillaceae bacterium]